MIGARLCAASLTLAFTALATWPMLAATAVLGWVGLGLLVLSLPVGPALAVLSTRRLLASAQGLEVVSSVVSTWVAVLGALSLEAFVLPAADDAGCAALLAGAAFLGALLAPSRAHPRSAPRR
jgi:hypothetical protein